MAFLQKTLIFVEIADLWVDLSCKMFAFVEMGDKESGQKAIDELNGKEIDGRAIKVNEAQPRTERPQRSKWWSSNAWRT